jgi:hypothetical protein
VIELTDDGYVALGDKSAVATDEARAAIIATAPISEADAVTEKDLLKATGTRRTVGQDVLRALVNEGTITRIGAGKRGDPYRCWRPGDKASAATSSLYAAERNEILPADAEKVSAGTPVVAAESNGPSELVISVDGDATVPETCRMPDIWERKGRCRDWFGRDCSNELDQGATM